MFSFRSYFVLSGFLYTDIINIIMTDRYVKLNTNSVREHVRVHHIQCALLVFFKRLPQAFFFRQGLNVEMRIWCNNIGIVYVIIHSKHKYLKYISIFLSSFSVSTNFEIMLRFVWVFLFLLFGGGRGLFCTQIR